MPRWAGSGLLGLMGEVRGAEHRAITRDSPVSEASCSGVYFGWSALSPVVLFAVNLPRLAILLPVDRGAFAVRQVSPIGRAITAGLEVQVLLATLFF